jgi:CheY-like chemotaxis protein
MPDRLILIADGDARNLKLFRAVLQFAGFDILAVSDGEEAVALASARLPDLVLMDLRLPGIDGKEATRRMRANQRTARIPVVALTTVATTGDREAELSEEGFDGHIELPISVRALPGQVRGFLDAATSARTAGEPGPTAD